MKLRSKAFTDRALRIEFLRTRAALERESLRHSAVRLREAFTLRGLLGGNGSRGSASILVTGYDVVTRYPYFFSTLSALLVGKRMRFLRAVGLGLFAWLTYRTNARSRDNQDQHPR
jgi:hypothetical protein